MNAKTNIVVHGLTRINLVWLRLINNVKDLYSDLRATQQRIRIMRFAVGVTLATALSSAFEWPLAFLTPILTSLILALPIPMPTLKAGLTNMFYTVLAFFLGLSFTLFLLPFPLAYAPMLALVLFYLYYTVNRGGSFWLVLMSIMAVLILPLLGNANEALAMGFAFGFVLSGWITILMIWLAHLLVPDPAGSPLFPEKAGMQAGYSMPAAQAALKSMIVVLPLVLVFITFELSSQLVVMIFAAIFTLSPDIAKGKATGIASMKSTVIGGLYAFIFYHLLVAVPEYHFYVLLMFLTTIHFGSRIFSENPSAKYYASAFTTLFVLVNSSLGAGANFTYEFFLRFLFIMLATIYVVFGLMVFERYWPQKDNQGT